MLKKMLENNIVVLEEIGSWEESIRVSSDSLLKKGYVESRYVEAMINNIKKLGPYVIIADDIAMPHSRPEDGVSKTSLGLLKLNIPIIFGEGGDYVRLIFTLAAQDSTSHIEVISSLVELLEDEEKKEKLLESRSIEEILKILE